MKSRFTLQEIERIVQESRTEGVAVTAYQYSVTEQTLYNWRKRLGISSGGYMRIGELKRLQQENARLKRLVAERDLDIDMMREQAGKNGAKLTERYQTEADTFWRDVPYSTALANYGDELGVENKPVMGRSSVNTPGHPSPLAATDPAQVQNTLFIKETLINPDINEACPNGWAIE